MIELVGETQNVDRNRMDSHSKWYWWDPPQDALLPEFCNDTSLHGLHYIGQPKRHITERIFWIVAFVIGAVAAGILIYQTFQRNEATPVIVSFQSKEQPINTIPFPAVTICSISPFSRKDVEELEELANSTNPETSKEAKENLAMIGFLCSANLFAQGQSMKNVSIDLNLTNAGNPTKIMDLLAKNTVSCEDIIRACHFKGLGETIECQFKTVVRENGKCCTFNMLPLPLLYNNPSIEENDIDTLIDNPAFGTMLRHEWHKNEDKINEWAEWNYEETLLLPPIENINEYTGTNLPFRQILAGKKYGLSLILDFNTEDYFCPALDSKGLMFTVHTPLDIPRVMDFPAVIDKDKEVFINVHPYVTFADPDIKSLSIKKRQCYLGNEKALKLYQPYTQANCMDDCTNNQISSQCGCALFYMPRVEGIPVCNISGHICMSNVLYELRFSINHICGHCLPLCEDISYRFETTTAGLQKDNSYSSVAWFDPEVEVNELYRWKDHNISVVHIFFGTTSVVPKLRKRLYGTSDLIANTGGILGLCLGFSVLSAVEVIYFVSVRAVWKKFYGKKSILSGICNSNEIH